MKLKNMIMVAGLACATLSSASAADGNVYITGSSAFRGTLMKYLRDNLTNTRAAFDKAVDTADITKSLDASSFIVMSGNFKGSPDVTTFYLSFTGSVAGIRDVADSQALAFGNKPSDFTTNAAYLIGTASPFGGLKKFTADSNTGALTSPEQTNVIPDFGFSDVFQSSTTYTTNQLVDTKVAVLPFQWVASKGAAASGITNMTPQIARQLFPLGTISLAHFTGQSADAANVVYALGRTDDSGTRLTAVAETGIGVAAGLHQYIPADGSSTVAVTSYTDVANGGYVSGGTLATALGRLTTKANGHSVSYAGVGDADAVVTNGGSKLTHNGVTLSAVADVTEGRYTFWCYEHLIHRQSNTGLSANAVTVLNDLKTNLPGAITSSSTKVIKLTDMQCVRTTDGETVVHKD